MLNIIRRSDLYSCEQFFYVHSVTNESSRYIYNLTISLILEAQTNRVHQLL
jgi:hypothetical protein